MNPINRFVSRAACLVALGAILVVAAPVAAQQGTITGTVTDTRTGSPIGAAQISIVGTQRGTLSSAEGTFRLPNVTAGEAQVRVTYIGYRAVTESVQVVPGQTTTVDFSLVTSALALDEVLVTGTAGRQDRRAQAASISTVDAAALTELAPITNVANLLQSRTAGVSLSTTSGTAGAGQRIRLRGSASINLSNEPIIIIDGIAMDSRRSQIYGVGGQTGSRLNDINPADIESIEIIKGPAAATLYGSDASAGVIQIRTKRGQTGSSLSQNITYGYTSLDQNWVPDSNFGTCSGTIGGVPIVEREERTLCFGQDPSTVVQDNPLARTNAFQTGQTQEFGYSARGGGDQYGYFVSFNSAQTEGTLPNNQYDRYTARVNFDFTPRDDLRFDASMGLGRTDTRFPQNDNNIYGYLGGAMLGSPRTVGAVNDGWYAGNRSVEAISAIDNNNMTIRVTPVLTVNYTQASWLSHQLNFGIDMSRSEARSFFPKNDQVWYGSATLNSGQMSQARQNRDEITMDYRANVQRAFGNDFMADIAVGAQAIAGRNDLTNATGQGFTTNAARSINAAAQTTGGQSYSEDRSAGIFSQLDLAWRDRMYLQLGGRLDKSSAFGAEASTFFNPKVGLSYVLSEEEYYPFALRNVIPTLRVRSVWGSTGRSPGSGASLTTFSSSPYSISSTSVGSGVLPNNPGNRFLEPERGEEWELGFDAGLLSERVGLQVTYYNKTSKNLILSRPTPGSLGFANNPLVNIGSLRNSGWEVGLNAEVFRSDNFSWDAGVNLSTNVNEVLALGDVEPFGTSQRVLEGSPVYGWWTHVVTEYDFAHNDGAGRAIVSDTMQFIGNPNPGLEGNVSSTISFLSNFQLYAQMDWMSDYIIYNNSDQFRERQFGTGERWINREDLEPEDRLMRFGPHVTESGDALNASAVNQAYYEDASHVRLREMTLSMTLPSAWANTFRAQRATLSVGGRNLALWTDYNGPDPEAISAANAGFGRSDFLTLPQPRSFLARVNLTF